MNANTSSKKMFEAILIFDRFRLLCPRDLCGKFAPTPTCRAMRYQRRTTTRHLKSRDSLNRVHRQWIYRWMFVCVTARCFPNDRKTPRIQGTFLENDCLRTFSPFRSDCYYFHRLPLCSRRKVIRGNSSWKRRRVGVKHYVSLIWMTVCTL